MVNIMKGHVLISKNGQEITWLEATKTAFVGIGLPSISLEFADYMLNYVVLEFPESAKTPTQTIYNAIYTHSKDSPVGLENEHIFATSGHGVWGLAKWQS